MPVVRRIPGPFRFFFYSFDRNGPRHVHVHGEARIVALEINEVKITAQLADVRTVSVPLAWSWRLANATPAQRNRFEIIGSGEGVLWPDIDEDISARGMLQGVPALPPQQKRANRRRRA